MNTQLERRSFIAGLTFGNWLAIALALLSIAFIVQNRDPVSIDLFFISARLPLWISLALVFLAGWLSGRFSRRRSA
jgi:uncharacterized integral membrane protein